MDDSRHHRAGSQARAPEGRKPDRHSSHSQSSNRAATQPAGGHASHDKHAGHDPDVFRRQLWVVMLLTVPVVIWCGVGG
ncbi:MAG: hypothetical protein WD402_07950, partial [Chloroflexota bacterium]